MSDQTFANLEDLAAHLREVLNDKRYVLLYAYNGTGKTRLSMAFKDLGKQGENRDTLYYNAFTEDLFHWDNDLEGDRHRHMRINADSKFTAAFRELALEGKIFAYLERYADFDFRIDYENWTITFSRGDVDHIKVSRGEENLFVWCVFLAICELAIGGEKPYDWVRFLYIDDPISSLDDNNAIAVASDLARLLKAGDGRVKTVISSHHGLFFNVMCNELKKFARKQYLLRRGLTPGSYLLQGTDETPFFHHVAMLDELKNARESGNLYTYHFNVLRSILEKTATFFGSKDFSVCIEGVEDQKLYARALNVLSHGKYSVYEPREMVQDNKDLFGHILDAFLDRYHFDLPTFGAPTTPQENRP